MARLFSDESSEGLYLANPIITTPPFSVSSWFYPDEAEMSNLVFGMADMDWDNQWYGMSCLSLAATQYLRVIAYGTSPDIIDSTTEVNVNAWNHCLGVWAATDDRKVYLNGGGKNTTAVDITVTGIEMLSIGYLNRFTPAGYSSGREAEVGIWNVALTDAEVAILAAGYSPLFVRPQNLVYYFPLIRDDDNCLMSGVNLTAVGTPEVIEHPRIIRPAG